MPTCGLAELACLNNICSVLITARCTRSLGAIPRRQPRRGIPVEPARFDPDLLLSSQQRTELSWYASCCYQNSCHGTAVEAPVSLQPLPGFPHCRARLLQLIGAVPGRPAAIHASCARTTSPPASCSTIFFAVVLGGRVNAEIHQVGQHPDRLVPLPRLLLVVAVDQHPPSFQGTGPLDQHPSAVGVRVLCADRLALA